MGVGGFTKLGLGLGLGAGAGAGGLAGAVGLGSWLGIGLGSLAHTFNENSKLMKMQLKAKFIHTFNENSNENATQSEIHTISIYPALEGLGFRI